MGYGESFQQLISVANKRIKVKSRFTLSRMITRKAEEVRHEIATIIASILDDLLSLGFTSDLWTSRALCNSNFPGIPDPGNSQDSLSNERQKSPIEKRKRNLKKIF